MKQKKFIFFYIITLFLSFSIFSETVNLENESKEIELSSKTFEVSETNEKKSEEKTELPKIKSQTQEEYAIQTEESKKNKNFFVRAYKTLLSLPFYFDLGCEPQLNGNKTYLSLEYDWSKKYSSFLTVSYATKLDLDSTTDFDSSEAEQLTFEADLKPYIIAFKSKKNAQKFITFEPGFLFSFESDDLIAKDIREYSDESAKTNIFTEVEYKVESINLIPYIATKMKFPLGKYVSLNSDFLFSPLFYNDTENNTTVRYADVTQNPLPTSLSSVWQGSSEYSGISVPYITANVYVNLINRLALVSGVTYKRTNYRSKEPQTTDLGAINLIKWRSGISILNLGKTELRFKTGIYYEYTWNLYESTDQLSTKSGSWIIGVNTYISN